MLENPNKNIEELNPFGKFCVTIGMIPSSYKNSLTYQEQLTWFCNFLENKVIPAVNNNAEALTELQNLYIQTKNYLDNYFDNLDVQNEINNKLDKMATDGSLTSLIKKYVDPIYTNYQNNINSQLGTQNKKIETLENRVNSFEKLDEGSTTGDAELKDIRIGADNEIYQTAGEAVRKQISKLQANIDLLYENEKPFLKKDDYQQGSLSNVGEIIPSTTRIVTSNIQHFDKNVVFSVKPGYQMAFRLFRPNNHSYWNNIEWTNSKIVIPEGVDFRVTLSRTDNNEIKTDEFLNLIAYTTKTVFKEEFNEGNIIPKLDFFCSGHSGGKPVIESKNLSRSITAQFLKFQHDVIFKLLDNDYNISIFFYNDDKTYNHEYIVNTLTEYKIPKNTFFKLYLFKKSNDNIATTNLEKIDASKIAELNINTFDSIVELINNKSYDNSYTKPIDKVYGYLKSNENKKIYIDEWIDLKLDGCQSMVIDTVNNQLIKLAGVEEAKIFDFLGNYVKSITKPLTGHDNDCCFIDTNNIFICGSGVHNQPTDTRIIYNWNYNSNTVEKIDLADKITDNTNGTHRVACAICETAYNSNKLYIVCADYFMEDKENYQPENDKLSVYTYNISSKEVSLTCEIPLKCRFIQGATCVNNILYVACNQEVSQGGYGVLIKIIDMNSYTLLDEFLIETSREPEGLNSIVINGTPFLVVGTGEWNKGAELLRFPLPINFI